MDELRGRGIDVFDLFTPLVREQRIAPTCLGCISPPTPTGLATGSPRGDAAAERVRAVVGADELLPRRNYRREVVTVSRGPISHA